MLGVTRFEVAKLCFYWMKRKSNPCKSHLMSIENHRTSTKVYGFTFNFDVFLRGFSLKSTHQVKLPLQTLQLLKEIGNKCTCKAKLQRFIL